MSERFELYGWRSLGLEAAMQEVASTLGVTFELHDSSFRGGLYYAARGDDYADQLIVQRNFEDEDGYAEPDFPEHASLLYVSGVSNNDMTTRMSGVGAELLRSEGL